MIQFNGAYLARKGKPIFNNMNLHIHENEKILIQGKSGIGKTTLFKILLGFETLDKGEVLFNGHAISKPHIKEIRGMVFYLSQDIDLKNERVQHLLDEIREIHHIENSDPVFEDFLELLDLNPKILSQHTRDLSGGERQRLGLLIGLILDRPVWLLDEPTSALDDAMKEKLVDYITALDKTMIIISHDAVWKKHRDIKIKRWV